MLLLACCFLSEGEQGEVALSPSSTSCSVGDAHRPSQGRAAVAEYAHGDRNVRW